MSLLCFLMVLLVFDSFAAAGRKVKRKENYHLNAPPRPPQQQHPSQQPHPHSSNKSPQSPYAYEEAVPPHYEEVYPPLTPQVSRYETEYIHHSSDSGSISSSGGGGGSGSFLVDNGLRSIAKGSADQASTAVASQNAAGKQASYVAKSTLAQAAAQAAGTAVAVLKGKEVMLRRLEEQNIETHQVMESELTQLQQAKRSAKAAQHSAQQAIQHVSVLTAALNNAQAAAELAQKSASEAAAELASQIDMVAQAKAKLEQLEGHLYAARLDYEETKEAAEKASYSAQEAQINANDAAVHANVELSESVHFYDKSDEHVAESIRSQSVNHNYGHK